MKSSCVVVVLLLAIAMASRLSLATAAAADRESSSIPAILGRELRGFVARAGIIFRPAGADGWGAAGVAEVKNLRAAALRRRPRKSAGSSASCVTATMCRKKRVICGKRCYGASRASLNHVPTRCVVKCKKCVPTC